MTSAGGCDQADVVFTFSLETLDDVVAREFCRPPDQTLLALAREGRVRQLVSADPWRSAPVSWARGRRPQLATEHDLAGRAVTRVRPLRARRRDPVDVRALRRSYENYGQVLGRALESRTGARGPASLVTYHPFVAAWCRPSWVSHTVYVGRDDWAASARLRPWWPAYRQAYEDLRRPHVSAFAVSDELAARLSPDGRVSVVPNGVDAGRWQPLKPVPSAYSRLPRPIAVYAGTIDDRLDQTLVEATADAVGTFVLVGPLTDGALRGRLTGHPRIRLLGRVGQDELVGLAQHADLGVIPHADTPLTRAMSPLKLYEYLAAGLPVVARDLPPVREVHDSVRLADARTWAQEVRGAVADGRRPEDERQAVVGQLSWSGRQAPVVDAALHGGPGLG